MVDPGETLGEGRRKRSSDVPLTGFRALDRKSFVPLYFQLGSALLERIETGAWPPGARFPSEREIAEVFGVSRTVIRPALELLVGDGAIVRVKGSGAFIASPRRPLPAFGLVKALSDPPDDLELTVLTARHDSPDSALAHFLEMEDQPVPVAHVTVVLRFNERPVGMIDSHSSTTLVPWVLPSAKALRAGGEKQVKLGKLELTRATLSLEHTFFGRWGGPQVGVSAGDPALMGRFVQYGRANGAKHERPVEFARLIYRGDSTQLAIELN
jgi:DNA-binding GntR family transcriptional regulator